MNRTISAGLGAAALIAAATTATGSHPVSIRYRDPDPEQPPTYRGTKHRAGGKKRPKTYKGSKAAKKASRKGRR